MPSRRAVLESFAALAVGRHGVSAMARAVEASATARRAEPNPVEDERIRIRVWWNRTSVVLGVGLRPEQRRRMDTLLAKRLEAQRALKSEYEDRWTRLEASIWHGQWQRARDAATRSAELGREALESRIHFMVDVMEILEPEQRRALRANHGRLLKTHWWKPLTFDRKR